MGEPAKGFPPFPVRKRRTRRAQTWWGNAWIDAMEVSSLDSEALRRGRAYAHGGHVGTITISPGRISATVYGSDHTPHETVVSLETFSADDWERLLGQVANRSGHVAALLDRDMPYELVADDAGVQLLPGMDDLDPRCSCEDWGHPCTHAAALCYQAAWLLDTDPFLLFLMRGRGEDELLEELQRRNARSKGPGNTGQAPPSVLDAATVERTVSQAAARAAELLARTGG